MATRLVLLCGCAAASALLNVRIRDFTLDDVYGVSSLLRRTFNAAANPVSGLLIEAEHALGLRERLADNILLTACADDGPVGFVEVYTPTFLAKAAGEQYPERVRSMLKAYVASLAVDQSSRSQGVGRALMLSAERRAAGMGWPCITLEVEEDNERAVDLYTKLGYTMVRRDVEGRRLVGDVFFGRSVAVTKLAFEKQLVEGG